MSFLILFFFPQAIQRQLEEVAEKQRDLEERGVTIEKIIRGETGTEQDTAPCESEIHSSFLLFKPLCRFSNIQNKKAL